MSFSTFPPSLPRAPTCPLHLSLTRCPSALSFSGSCASRISQLWTSSRAECFITWIVWPYIGIPLILTPPPLSFSVALNSVYLLLLSQFSSWNLSVPGAFITFQCLSYLSHACLSRLILQVLFHTFCTFFSSHFFPIVLSPLSQAAKCNLKLQTDQSSKNVRVAEKYRVLNLDDQSSWRKREQKKQLCYDFNTCCHLHVDQPNSSCTPQRKYEHVLLVCQMNETSSLEF